MKIPIYVSSLALKLNLNLLCSIHPLSFTWLLKSTPYLPTVPIWMHKMATAWYHGSFSWLQSETLAGCRVRPLLPKSKLLSFSWGKHWKISVQTYWGTPFLPSHSPVFQYPAYSQFMGIQHLPWRPDDPSTAKNWDWEELEAPRHAQLVKVRRLSRPVCACSFHPSVTFPKARLEQRPECLGRKATKPILPGNLWFASFQL